MCVCVCVCVYLVWCVCAYRRTYSEWKLMLGVSASIARLSYVFGPNRYVCGDICVWDCLETMAAYRAPLRECFQTDRCVCLCACEHMCVCACVCASVCVCVSAWCDHVCRLLESTAALPAYFSALAMYAFACCVTLCPATFMHNAVGACGLAWPVLGLPCLALPCLGLAWLGLAVLPCSFW